MSSQLSEEQAQRLGAFEDFVFNRLVGIDRDAMMQSERQIANYMVRHSSFQWYQNENEIYLERA